MWKCEKCGGQFENKTMAVDVRTGFIGENEAKEKGSQFDAFQTEQGWGPFCDNCAVEYIKNGE